MSPTLGDAKFDVILALRSQISEYLREIIVRLPWGTCRLPSACLDQNMKLKKTVSYENATIFSTREKGHGRWGHLFAC